MEVGVELGNVSSEFKSTLESAFAGQNNLFNMTKFADWIAEQTGYQANIFSCSFNQNNKNAIVRGYYDSH